MEAVKQGSATVGLKSKTHAVLVALKVTSNLCSQDSDISRKVLIWQISFAQSELLRECSQSQLPFACVSVSDYKYCQCLCKADFHKILKEVSERFFFSLKDMFLFF